MQRSTSFHHLRSKPTKSSNFPSHNFQKRWHTARHGLSEVEASTKVGITEFLAPPSFGLQGFPSRLREYKRDFQVREITLKGEVLQLSGPLWTKKLAAALVRSDTDEDSTCKGKPDFSLGKNIQVREHVLATSPEQKGKDYLHFRLYQENIGTNEAIATVARCLGRPTRDFRFAGMKDRRSISVQAVSVQRLDAYDLQRAALHPMWNPRVRFSDLEYRTAPLQIGDLAGNRFELVLRGLFADLAHVVPQNMHALVSYGFLNYFGLQRFGTQEISTYHVGVALLRRDWPRAVELILGSAKELLPEVSSVNKFPTRQALPPATIQAIQRLPHRMHVERDLLRALVSGQSPETALRRLPWNVLFFYLNAAQSIIFNHVLSQRVHVFGSAPVPEDFRTLAESSLQNGISKSLAKPSTFGDAASQASMHNVVLPVPGRFVEYPVHLRDEYEAACKHVLGVPLQAFHDEGFLPLDGAYRAAAVLPKNVQWRLVPPEEVCHLGRHLAPSDVDKLYAAEYDLPPMPPSSESASSEAALLMSCDLPPSAYVTMAIRELSLGETIVREAHPRREPPREIRVQDRTPTETGGAQDFHKGGQVQRDTETGR